MAINRPLRFIRPLFLPRDKNNMEFWLSHALIVGSTVLGVYLAALAGYKVAVEFEAVKSQRAGYYLQSALMAELSDNLDHVEQWVEIYVDIGRGRNTFTGRPEQYSLETFVWSAMATSNATFEVPPEVLTGVRRFYRRTAGNLARMTDNAQTTLPNIKQMRRDLEQARQDVMPALGRSVERLRRRLEQVQVTLD
jgi:hypothetical protein